MIEVSHLSKKYGTHPAIEDLSFTVGDGQIFGLLGPNGAGKSTIMNILTGYLAPTSGEVKVAGFSLPEQAQQAKAEHTLHFETERARTRANRELSAARMQARAKLAAQRQQIAADAFAAARTQLATFAAGKDYAAWLVKSAAALAETMGESGTLYARTADLPLLQGKLPAGVALAADDTITLGGLRAANPATGLAADDTLEARLDAQHDWFLQNAGLEITI